MSDAFPFDQREDVVGTSRFGEHHPRAFPEKAADAGAREGKVVRDRKRDQEAVVGADIVDGDGGFGVVHVVVVRPRDQLRHTGRAT